MGRTIITRADIESAASDEVDTRQITDEESEAATPVGLAPIKLSSKSKRVLRQDAYLDKIVKYIPSEVVALYLSLDLICRSNAGDAWLRWLILGFGFVATPLYLWRIQSVRKWIQLLISTAAFLVWAFALGGPFVTLSWYKPVYGAVLLPMFTFIMPLINPGAETKR